MLHTFEEFWTENLMVSIGFREDNVIEKTHIPSKKYSVFEVTMWKSGLPVQHGK